MPMLNTILNGAVLVIFIILGIKLAGKVLKLILFLIALCATVNLLSNGGIL